MYRFLHQMYPINT